MLQNAPTYSYIPAKDVALSTVMLHHLPQKVRPQCVREIRRVLKPDGRLLAIDFANPAGEERGSFLTGFHRHGRVNFPDVIAMLSDAGFNCVKSGPVGFGGLQFVLVRPLRRHQPFTWQKDKNE